MIVENTRDTLCVHLLNSTQEWAAHLLDISYFGARVALLDDYQITPENIIRLRIEIPESKVAEGLSPFLNLHGKLVHQHGHMLGIKYEPMTEADAELLDRLLTNLT